jgi:hypothetical protein
VNRSPHLQWLRDVEDAFAAAEALGVSLSEGRLSDYLRTLRSVYIERPHVPTVTRYEADPARYELQLLFGALRLPARLQQTRAFKEKLRLSNRGPYYFPDAASQDDDQGRDALFASNGAEAFLRVDACA